MSTDRQRFTVLQRVLHWLMALCLLAMLFIGVGMVSTVMPKYVPLLATHKTLGIAILALALIRLGVRARYGAPTLPADLPEPMKLAAHLSHYGLYALMIAMPLLGWGMMSAGSLPGRALRQYPLTADPPAQRRRTYAALGRALLSGVCLLRPHPHAYRCGAVSRAHSTRRCFRDDGVRVLQR